MVQNWENFMMPDGGNNLGENNALMSGGMGLLFGLGVDWLGTPILNRLEKAELKFASRVAPKFGQKDINEIADNVKLSPNRRIYERVKRQHIAERRAYHQTKKLRTNIRSNYNTLRAGAKLIGWGLLGMTAASIVESMTSPGLTMEARQSDSRVMSAETYLDSPQSYTQRQRALMAIHESQLGIRGIISQEASGFHK